MASTKGTIKNNPKDPLYLTDEQKTLMVTATFENVSSFKMTFGAIPDVNKRNARIFEFSSKIPLCEPPRCVETQRPEEYIEIEPIETNVKSDKHRAYKFRYKKTAA